MWTINGLKVFANSQIHRELVFTSQSFYYYLQFAIGSNETRLSITLYDSN
jgi:hypothetical protein